MAYNGSIDLISGIRPKNNGDFPLADAKDIFVSDGKRLNTALDEKADAAQTIPKPAEEGTTGQILRIDEEGTPAWSDVGTPTEEQVGAAVDAWMDDHPEATTTVQDGSITRAKLDADLQQKTDEVGELKSATNNKINAVYSGTYAFKPGYIRNGLSVGQTCDYKSITADDSWRCLVLEDVPVGTKFHIKTDGANSARGYSWLDSSGVIIEVPGKTETQTMTAIQCPQGASILVVNERLGVSVVPEFYRDDSMDALKEAIGEFDPSAYVEKSGLKQVTIENCDFTEQFESVNRCNPNGIQWDKGIDASGNVVDAAGYILTDEIPVAGNYAFFSRGDNHTNARRLGLYKKDGTFERVSNAQQYDVSNCNKIRAMIEYTSQQDVFFVGFNNVQAFPEIDEYESRIVIDDDYLPEPKGENHFNGLSAVAFGTSLTARANEDHKYEYATYGYLTYLRNYSGMAIDNQGIGGANILEDGAKSIYTAITGYQSFATKNVCIIEGFVNDWAEDAENTLGQYLDSSQTTVCGRLRSAINYIMAANANITIFVILDHYGKNGEINCSSTAKIHGLTQYEYYKELEKVCESLGVVVIKDYLSGISELAPQYLLDNIHLNDLGARQSATTIWNQMKQYAPKI